jgi:hypothetical protein
VCSTSNALATLQSCERALWTGTWQWGLVPGGNLSGDAALAAWMNRTHILARQDNLTTVAGTASSPSGILPSSGTASSRAALAANFTVSCLLSGGSAENRFLSQAQDALDTSGAAHLAWACSSPDGRVVGGDINQTAYTDVKSKSKDKGASGSGNGNGNGSESAAAAGGSGAARRAGAGASRLLGAVGLLALAVCVL